MSHITPVETFDLEPGLTVRVSENVFAEILHIYSNWMIENQFMMNFSNKRFDGSYEATKTWEVVSV